ncbi:MAG: ABC transporter permease [Myxococcales bacterium]|nr:ABC transporter permease [Myxococcales bacterium]
MFNIDRWREILDTLWRNKLRSLLTAFSMAWGVFMLVVLLGLGNGLSNGVQASFADDATNSVWMFTGTTSVPFQGMPLGRRITLDNSDVEATRNMPKVDHVTGRFRIENRWVNDLKIRAGGKVSTFDVRAVHPDHLYLERTTMTLGRYLTDLDVKQRAKVAVVGVDVATFLFDELDVVGRWLDIDKVPYRIVGVFTDDGGEGERAKIYVPITTAQAAYNAVGDVHMLMFTVGDATVEETEAIASGVRQRLGALHKFSPDDKQALRVRNNVEQFQSIQRIFTMISLFVWVMAAGTILAGVVGISNIMMIVVRERTKEIGIRKALGAHPRHIIGSVVQEAVALTAAAGYLGLCGGVGLLALASAVIPKNEMFADPSIDLRVAIAATVVLVISGTLAGLFPALAAARVNPIEALRDEG